MVLPALALGAWSVLARRADLLRPRALARRAGRRGRRGPWYLYMGIAHRDLLFETFIGQGNLGPSAQGPSTRRAPSSTRVLALGLVPWSGALPFALVESVREARRSRREASRRRGAGAIPARPLRALLVRRDRPRSSPSRRAASRPTSSRASRPRPCSSATTGREGSSRRVAGARTRGTPAWVLPAIVGVPCALVLGFGARSDAALEWIPSSRSSCRWRPARPRLPRRVPGRAHRRPVLFLTAQVATSVLDRPVRRVRRRAPRGGAPVGSPSRPRAAAARVDSEVAGAFHERDFSMDFYLGRTLPRATGRKSLQDAVAARPERSGSSPRANVVQVMGNKRLSATLVAESSAASALRLAPAERTAPRGPGGAAPSAQAPGTMSPRSGRQAMSLRSPPRPRGPSSSGLQRRAFLARTLEEVAAWLARGPRPGS
jgi:hypothetical protein